MAEEKNMSKSLERVVAETAMLAGESMLSAGAEISRVEDTMNRILDYSKCDSHTAFVLATGITLTLDSDEGLITMSKRVPERTTNINRIYLVNNVSRALSSGKTDIYTAYKEITRIKYVRQFRGVLYGLSFVGVALFFTMMLGGDFTDCVVAGVGGLAMAVTQWVLVPFGFNSFFLNMISTFAMTLTAIGFQRFLLPGINLDLVIIGGIMPIVPGVIFTTAMRDTLNGDYTAGVSRGLETGVVAFAVAVGVALAYVIL